MGIACVISSMAASLHNYQGYLEAVDRYTLELQERQRLQFDSRVGPSGRQVDRSLRVLRPPNLAAILVVGVERALPSGWDFGPAGVSTLPPYAVQEPLAAFDVLTDAESVLRLFGGLMAIALGFWMVTRDRQRGWLGGAVWFPTPRWWLLSALLAAGTAVLAVIAMIWFAGSLLFAVWLAGPDLSTNIAFLETWLFAWIYLVTMFGAGALIARVVSRPLVGMTAVGVTWMVLILLGPQLIAMVARMSSASTPRARLEQERQETYADRQKAADDALSEMLAASASTDLSKAEADSVFTEVFPRFEPAWRAAMREARSESDATNREWLDARAQWVARLQEIARVTPGTLLQTALASANRQSWSTHRQWEEAISKHEAALNRALFDDRSGITLRIRWNDAVLPWAYLWHSTLLHSELPQFNVADATAARDRSAFRLDVAAGLLQVAVVLLFTAYIPERW